MPLPHSVVVDGYVADDCDLSLHRSQHVWALALDQRVFGPRRLIVAFGAADGRLVGLAHTPRVNPPELTLGFCFEYFLDRADADQAIAYCDEPVRRGPMSPRLVARWGFARAIAEHHGIELLDWIACDDQEFRSARLAAACHRPGR
jgi:hypothetical protein